MRARYDQATDGLYVDLRPLPAVRTVAVEDDVALDIGEDGKPVGYDIQHASTKRAFIARLILELEQASAELGDAR
jgi:uncharacterized protein YuzE